MTNIISFTRKKCKFIILVALSVELVTLGYLKYSGRLSASTITRNIPKYKPQNADEDIYQEDVIEKDLDHSSSTISTPRTLSMTLPTEQKSLTNGPTIPSSFNLDGNDNFDIDDHIELFPPMLQEELKKSIVQDMQWMIGRKERPRFNPEFKNPCWYEEAPQPGIYNANWYRDNHPFRYVLPKKFDSMETDLSLKWVQTGKRLRCLPYFYLAGIAKCGTTDLYQRIKGHPEVADGLLKVTQWWGRLAIRIKGNLENRVSFDEYLDLFDRAASDIEDISCTNCSKLHPHVVGDYSTSTLFDNDFWPGRLGNNVSKHEPDITVAHYIRYLQPEVKIIAIFREPTARLYSDYLFFTEGIKAEDKSPEKFHEWASAAVLLFLSCTKHYTVRSCVYNKDLNHQKPLALARLRLGMYHVFVKDFLSVFPRDQILFLRLEDYHNDMTTSLHRVYDFLGLRTLKPWEEEEILAKATKNSRVESYSKIGKMWDSTRTLLRDFYASHNDQLADLLNDDRYRWADVLADVNTTVSR